MPTKLTQLSLSDIYEDVLLSFESPTKPTLIQLLETYIDFASLIPLNFHLAFYKSMGRKHLYHLESFLRALVLQKLFGFSTDSQLISVLNCSNELRDFCGFSKVPDTSQLTRFKHTYCAFLADVFEHLVDLTEPICRQINSKKADYLIFDTTGIEPAVSENNPKFLASKLKSAKKYAKTHSEFDPYRGVYSLLPDASAVNSDIRQQYVNGHFCYALKAGILSNSLGIIRHIAFFDTSFKNAHPELLSPKSNEPIVDKEIGDSTALKPVLSDFFDRHPLCRFSTFIGDAAFDSYDNYSLLKDDFRFERVCIPLNKRNSKKASDACFNASGTPICPKDGTPFIFLGKSGGANRSRRFKWVCPKSMAKGSSRILTCEEPCTESKYGKCVYTYPDKDFRLYPGIARDSGHWDNLYRHRVTIERTINLMKDCFGVAYRRSYHSVSLKAEMYLAGIVQLIGVLLADALHKPDLIKSVRKLMKAA